MKYFYFFILLLFFNQTVTAQSGSVKGIVFDSSLKRTVSNATITLLQKKDSSLVSFSMTGANGQFNLTGLANGEYRLLVTHTSYHSVNKYFTISNEKKNVDLDNVIITDKTKTLEEVVITNEAPPVTLIGDTIQYNAGSFKTKPNANVEDLLKKLPGVKVDKDGTVKAQGEKVKNVLVDGKEFFGNDPKVATKNLPADAIDKVQVYDKQSDQSQLTGFDDGNSEKTINLKLKKDKKKGMFGKASAGVGTDNRYQGKFNLNSFKGARQMSVIGMANNCNAEGFSFMDILNFTGALSQMRGSNGDISLNISPDDPLAGLVGGNNSGINTTLGTGVNYNNIIGNKTDFRSNYFFSRYNPYRESRLQRQYVSPANLYSQNSSVDNINLNHRLNINADIQLDSFNSIKINAAFSQQDTKNRGLSNYKTITSKNSLLNDGNSDNAVDNNGYNFNAGILYRKKFHRRGRTFSINLQGNFNNSDGNGRLRSLTRFYDTTGGLLINDSINQQSTSNAGLDGYTARMIYTEPIFKRSLLEFSIGRTYINNKAAKETFDYNNLNGKFDLPNAALTNDFVNTYNSNNAGIRLRKQTKKYNFAVGVSLQNATLEGSSTNSDHFAPIKKTFSNLLPNARFQYQFSRYKTITLNYTTNTNQPSITQLQPIPDNSDRLSIKVGNPNLSQEYNHNIRLNATFTNPFKNRNLFAFATFQLTQNKIVNSNNISSLGIDSVKLVNTNGVYNINSSISYSFPVRFLKATIEVSAVTNYNKGKQFLKDASNSISQLMVAPFIRIDMSPSEKLTIGLSAEISYYNTKYSLQPKANNNYFYQEYGTDIGWQLPKGFFFSTDLNYQITNQQAAGYNQHVPIWNMSISKQLLHFNRGELKLSVNDLLNKNTNINRTANLNYIEDRQVNSLRRYFILSFTYNLSKTGLDKSTEGGGRIIRR